MPVEPTTSPSTAPDYPDRGAQRVSFTRSGRVHVVDIAATTVVDVDLADFPGFLGTWLDLTLTGGNAGYFFMTRAQADDTTPLNPDLAARTPAVGQCGELADGVVRPGWASAHNPVLRLIGGVAATVLRIENTQV